MTDRIPESPVLVVGFNRADLLLRSLEQLFLCAGAGKRPVVVYLDAPRGDHDREKCDRTVAAAVHFAAGHPNVEIVRRERNLGCRRNISTAVQEMLERFDRVIVLEDDVLMSRTFLAAMDLMLAHFQGDGRIFNVQAHRGPYIRMPRGYRHDVYLAKRFMCSAGWGTWRDRWPGVDFDFCGWDRDMQDAAFRKKVDDVGLDLWPMMEMQASGALNSWAISCVRHMVRNDLYSVEPVFALAKNAGFMMAEAVHTTDDDPVRRKQKYYDFMPTMPECTLMPDAEVLRRLKYALYFPGSLRFIVRRVARRILRMGLFPENNDPVEVRGRGLGKPS